MDQTPVGQPTYDFKSAKKQFSRIGLALIAFFAATYAAMYWIQFILAYALGVQSYPTWAAELVSCVSMYGVGVPIFRLCLCGTKCAAPQRGKVNLSTIGILFLIAYAMSYVGSILGNLSSAILEQATGIPIGTNVSDVMTDLPWYVTLLCVVIVGPLFEELVFRKMILDRTRAYGEKLAIFFSALLFAFFHTNPEQFFYAFLIGLVLSYLYLRTGKLTACWLLHAAYNFFGGLLPGVLLQQFDLDALAAAETAEQQMQLITENPIGYALILLYSMLVMGAVIAGFVLLGIYKKRLRFAEAELTLPHDSEASTAFVNVGVILFIALCSFMPFLQAILVQMA